MSDHYQRRLSPVTVPEVFQHYYCVLNCTGGGRLSRGEEIFPDFQKVGDENAAFWKQHLS